MTEEEKELLLKDLCARLYYGVICQIYDPQQDYGEDIFDARLIQINAWTSHCYFWGCSETDPYKIEQVKPYLRPMSSMTEEEIEEFSIFIGKTETYRQQICLDSDSMCNPTIGGYKCVYWGLLDKCVDWLNAHHFDYRGLIEKGLAIEAPEGMYNLKEK